MSQYTKFWMIQRKSDGLFWTGSCKHKNGGWGMSGKGYQEIGRAKNALRYQTGKNNLIENYRILCYYTCVVPSETVDGKDMK